MADIPIATTSNPGEQQAASSVRLERPPQKRRRRLTFERLAPYLFVAPFFLLFAAFGLFPSLYALWLSFTRWHGADNPVFIGMGNYQFLLSDNFFWQSIGNSLYLWLLIVPIQTIMAVMVAALLSLPRLKGRWFFRTAFLTPYLVPLVAIAQVWLILFDRDAGVINALLALAHLPAVGWFTTAMWAKPTMAMLVFWKSSGFAILIMLAAIQGIPQELYEASSLDGANAIQQFWFITVPLLRRAIGFFMVIATLGVLQMFAEPYVLTQGGPYNTTMTAGYYLFTYINNLDLGTGAANSFLLLILLVTVALLMLRLLRSQEEV